MSRAFRLGVFIVATLAILATGVFLIGQRQFLFTPTYRLSTTFKAVGGLGDGAEVRVGGVHKGTVRRIELPKQPDGTMTVVMAMDRSTRQVIRKDSLASIATEGLLGSKYVEISFGSADAPPIENGDTIGSVPPLDFPDLMRKTNDILDATNRTMTKIDQGKGTMGALVNDKKVYQELNEAAAQAKTGAAAFQENMQALKHNWFLRGFFKNRGYEDSAKLGQHEIPRLPRTAPAKKFIYDAKQIFADVDTAKLKNDKTLAEAGRFLEQNRFGLAVVVAAGGMKGDTEELEVLMQARAMVVRDYLVKNFKMDDTRLKTLGLAKSDRSPTDAGSIEIDVYPAGVR